MVQGLNIVPASDEPTIAEVNTVHLAWDVMVGTGTIMCLIAAWYWGQLDLPAKDAAERAVPALRQRGRESSSVIALESGWVVSEVGRQPWIVYNLMKVEAAATANTGVWVTFIGVVVLYAGLGVTTILILRAMSRRFREQDERGDDGLRRDRLALRSQRRRTREHRSPVEVGSTMSTAVAVVLFIGITAYALFGGADFGAGHLGSRRRRGRPAARDPARSSITRSVPSGRRTTSGSSSASSCCGRRSPRPTRRSR